MRDMDREQARLLALQKLADPAFREGLTGTAPDGSHPIVVALPEDVMIDVLDELNAVGQGAGNLVVPMLNGIVVLALEPLTRDADAITTSGELGTITSSCTVGVFLQQMSYGSHDMVYRFVYEHEGRRDSGMVHPVALAS